MTESCEANHLFRSICGYLFLGTGQNSEALLQEARSLIPAIRPGTGITQSAMTSGSLDLVEDMIAQHGKDCLSHERDFTAVSFWDWFDTGSFPEETLLAYFTRFADLGVNLEGLKSSFPRLARMAIRQDNSGFLQALLQYCEPQTDVVATLLLNSAVILNCGPRCAGTLQAFINPQTAPQADWDALFERSIRKLHFKTAAVLLKCALVSNPQDSAGPDTEKKARFRLPYMLGSAHGRLKLLSILPEAEKLLGMNANAVDNMLDAKLKHPSVGLNG